jgi:hypothetical protein
MFAILANKISQHNSDGVIGLSKMVRGLGDRNSYVIPWVNKHVNMLY